MVADEASTRSIVASAAVAGGRVEELSGIGGAGRFSWAIPAACDASL
jgi:hypothetical protein